MKHLALAAAKRHNTIPSILLAGLLFTSGAVTTEVAAKGGAQLLPKTSLYYKVSEARTEAEIKAICTEMVARQDASAIGRRDASSLYMHGKIKGVSCVKVDYFKALVLAHDSGDAFTLKAALTYIRDRAAGGNAKAISALEKFEKAYD
ncbi:hypothetical protein [Devosia sp.]|uniref:hypothetical protein n=1 Tax=Devosia sp. TaxID=1871048 RepID=UPI003F722F98